MIDSFVDAEELSYVDAEELIRSIINYIRRIIRYVRSRCRRIN